MSAMWGGEEEKRRKRREEDKQREDAPIPPHMPSIATLVLWVSKAMEGSVHVVPVTSAPETTWAGIAAAREAERTVKRRVEMYMLMVFF
jgi:hypothetical protein